LGNLGEIRTPAGKYAPYMAGRVARERRRWRERAAQAMEVARQAAALLRAHYPVTRVRVFGSANDRAEYHIFRLLGHTNLGSLDFHNGVKVCMVYHRDDGNMLLRQALR